MPDLYNGYCQAGSKTAERSLQRSTFRLRHSGLVCSSHPPWLCWKEGEQVAVAVLFALQRLLCCLLLLCLPCGACFAACCYCMTAGWDATSNAIVLDVAFRRRFCLATPQPAARGLLSLISLLRGYLLAVGTVHGQNASGWHPAAGGAKRAIRQLIIGISHRISASWPSEPTQDA